MEKPDTSKIMKHFSEANAPITLLLEQSDLCEGCSEAALILLLSWLDRMAWLSVPDESNGIDFKAWVNKYLLVDSDIPCSADDLWGSRCGLLHTGSAEARDVIKGRVRTVLYYDGPRSVVSRKPEHVYVNIRDLHCGLIGAVGKFVEFLKSNPEKLELANRKLGKMLKRRPIA
jgi:hypothetical protein